MNIGDPVQLNNVEGIEDTGLTKGTKGVATNIVSLASGSGTAEKYVLFCPDDKLEFTWMSMSRLTTVEE